MQSQVFPADKLHGDRGHTHDRDHDRKHGEIADCFPNGVKRLAQSGSGQDLTHPRLHVAIDRILHQIKSSERKKGRDQESHEAAEISRVVETPVLANGHRGIGGVVWWDEEVADVESKAERDEKAVTA